jgi:recombinational DNA repair protein RecT
MPDYKKLRDMISHRVTFDYDTGARVIGYVASCAPAQGAVQLLVLSKVQVLDPSNDVLAKYDELPLVPNNLVGFRVTEGPL